MPTATIQNRRVTNSVPPYIVTLWEDTIGVPASSDSTSLIILQIPGLVINRNSYLQVPKKKFESGVCYAMRLTSFNISCLSTNFDVKILNTNDITKIDTYNEVLSYSTINKSMIDSDLGELVITNRDSPISNYLYMYISNNAGIATGSIFVEMTYLNLQEVPF